MRNLETLLMMEFESLMMKLESLLMMKLESPIPFQGDLGRTCLVIRRF